MQRDLQMDELVVPILERAAGSQADAENDPLTEAGLQAAREQAQPKLAELARLHEASSKSGRGVYDIVEAQVRSGDSSAACPLQALACGPRALPRCMRALLHCRARVMLRWLEARRWLTSCHAQVQAFFHSAHAWNGSNSWERCCR